VYFVLHPNDRYHRARLGGMKTGIYAYTPRSRKYGFRAGSYGGYNLWRDQLSRFALGVPAEDVWLEPRRYRGKPFAELIDFTDCDGRIGTTVAAKLAEDFATHAARARRFAATLPGADPNGWSPEEWLASYRDFARAFRLAAKDGALTFC
jgi:hypothetical protein